MKPTKEIIGLRIISITDGTQVGSVKDVVINPQEKSLDFVVVDQPTDIFGAKVISFTHILGVGEFAVTILEPNVIQDVIQSAEAKDLLIQDTKVIGTKVLTKKGQMIGEVTELLVDEETGRVVACLFESQRQMCQVGIDKIITFGKELMIIEEVPSDLDIQVQMPSQVQTPDQVQTINQETKTNQDQQPVFSVQSPEIYSAGANDAEVKAETKVEPQVEPQIVPAVELKTEPQIAPIAEPKVESNVAPITGKSEEIASPPKPETNFNLFEQRQLQYFIGKRVEKDIVLDNAEILRAGEQITPEIVANITTKTTLMEVSSHLQKN